jgi:acyl carrier protein
MPENNLKNEIKAIIANLIEIADFGDNERFVHDLGVDSLMALEIVARIEKTFLVKIDESKLIQIKTLNDAVRVTQESMDALTATR